MATRYTHIRVPVEVKQRVESFARRLERSAIEGGQRRLPDRGNTGEIVCPLWHAIDVALAEVEAHRERGRGKRRTDADVRG